jgi:hypothetical protein
VYIETASPDLFIGDSDEPAGTIVEYDTTDIHEGKTELDRNSLRVYDDELVEVESKSLTVADVQAMIDDYATALAQDDYDTANEYNANQFKNEDYSMLSIDSTNNAYWLEDIGQVPKVTRVQTAKEILTDNGYDMSIVQNQYAIETAYSLSGEDSKHRNVVGTHAWMFYNLTACELETPAGTKVALAVYVMNDDTWKFLVDETQSVTLEEFAENLIDKNDFVK